VFSGIQVSWTYPSTNPYAVQYTLLYRATSANFAEAIEIAHAAGSVYTDHFNQDTAQQFWYWIKIVSVNGTIGERIGPASVVLKPRKEQTVEDVQNQLTNNAFTQVLRDDILLIGQNGLTIEQHRLDRISADAVLAEALDRVQSGLDASMTYINTEITNRSDADSALVSVLNTLGAAVEDNSALIFTEQTVRADADSALASSVTDLYAKTGANTASINSEIVVRTNQYSAISQQVTTLSSTVDGNTSTGQIGLVTKVNQNTAGIASLGAQFYVKFNVNGYISGFTVYNTGATSAAIFDVDSFFIGRLDTGATAPFIVADGTTYINNAKIRNADITTLKIGGNAVTVPFSQTFSGTTYGSGINSWTTVASGSITIDQAGVVYGSCNAAIAYGSGWVPAQTRLWVNNSVVQVNGGDEGYVTASHAYGVSLSAGTHTFAMQFAAQDNRARIIDPTLFIQGAKR